MFTSNIVRKPSDGSCSCSLIVDELRSKLNIAKSKLNITKICEN